MPEAPTLEPYSRLYHKLADEYPEVYDSPDLAGYCRLLVAADQAWPTAARWAGLASRQCFDRLVACGLVIPDGQRYRIRGLDKHRIARSKAAARAAQYRWNAPRNADGNAPRIADSNAEVMPRRDETRRDEPRRVETGSDAIDLYYQLTIRTPSQGVIEWLDRLVSEHGQDTVLQAMPVVWSESPNVKDFLSRVEMACVKESRRRASEDELARRRRAKEREAAERAEIESMPPEQRAANMARLKAEMVAAGLVKA